MTGERAGAVPAVPSVAGSAGRVVAAAPADVAGYDPVDFQVPDETAALIREAVPENTALAYQSRWRLFEAWCRHAGRVALPATAQTVAAYLTYLAVDRGLKATTADAHLTAIRAVHRGAGAAPPDGLAARKVVTATAKREAARDGRYGPRKAVPVMAADLPAIVAACDLATPAGLRDQAVILLGFALLARRAELAALSVSDIEHVPGEGLAVTIRASKTDQTARGRVRRIHYASAEEVCPVRAVLAWQAYLAAHEITAGPLFVRIDRWGNLGPAAGGRYARSGGPGGGAGTARRGPGAGRPAAPPETVDTGRDGGWPGGGPRPAGRNGRLRPQAIGDIVAAACAAAGLAVPDRHDARDGDADGRPAPPPEGTAAERRRYSGHSLRRGGATSMLKAGAQPLNVSRHGRWADGSRAFAGYVEEATGFGDANPTKDLLLPAAGTGTPAGRRLGRQRAASGPRGPAAVLVSHLDGMAEGGGHVRGGERRGGGPGRHDPPVGQQQGVRGGGRQFLQVVRHQYRRDLRVRSGEQVDGLEQLLPGRDVQAGRGLVEQQQPGLADQRPRDEHPAALALGQHVPPGAGLASEAERRDQLVGPVRLGLGRPPAQRRLDRAGEAGEHDVAHRQRRAERVTRVDVPDRAPQGLQLDPAELLAEHAYRSRRRVGDGAAEAEERALARPVRPDHGPVLARSHGERDAVNDLVAVTAVGHVE
jgi:integrase